MFLIKKLMQNIYRNIVSKDCKKVQLQASCNALAETLNCNNQLANGLMKLQTMVNQPGKFQTSYVNLTILLVKVSVM